MLSSHFPDLRQEPLKSVVLLGLLLTTDCSVRPSEATRYRKVLFLMLGFHLFLGLEGFPTVLSAPFSNDS